PADRQQLADQIGTAMKALVDGWVRESTADYFDEDEMEALGAELEEKATTALEQELIKHGDVGFTEAEKEDMLAQVIGYVEYSLNF
ncbi:MAG: hypothetical protein FWH40_07585, partial [Coriobacteriia bacterium]|nr:hypothetical protein [Coriobacteriia bacterium]